MAPELFGLFKDVMGFAKVAAFWRQTRRPGGGIDYTAEAYRDAVRRAVERVHPRRMRLAVREVIAETKTTATLRTVRVDGDLPPFRPGQYVSVFVELDGVRTSRPLSISSRPGADHLDLTVREKPGGFVSPHLVDGVKEGDELTTSGPAGGFVWEPLAHGDDLVFIAGGSGITPFMSMLRWAQQADWPFKATLIYGNRKQSDVIFAAPLTGVAKGNPFFSWTSVVSEPTKSYKGARGLIDAKVVTKCVGDPAGKTFFLCGPNAMYDFVLPELDKLGVPRHKVRRELYGPPDDVTMQPGWPAKIKPGRKFTVAVGGRTIEAAAGEPLLNSLERSGIAQEALCRSGECSLCRTRLVSGTVYMPPTVGLREADRAFGYIHACVAYPISDLEIRL